MFFAATSSGAPKGSASARAGSTSSPSPSGSNAYANHYHAKWSEAGDEAVLAFDAAYARYLTGTGTLEDCVKWSDRARSIGHGASPAEEHRDRLLKLEAEVKKRVAAGSATELDLHEIAYHRAIAEASAP